MKTLELTPSMLDGLDSITEAKEAVRLRELRFLRNCLVELGGMLNDPWQLDHDKRLFWMNGPEPEPATVQPEPAPPEWQTVTMNKSLDLPD